MRGNPVGVSLVVLMLMAGCPTEFGKDGRVNKAVREDALELVSKPCSPNDLERYCGPGKENSPKCIEKCG